MPKAYGPASQIREGILESSYRRCPERRVIDVEGCCTVDDDHGAQRRDESRHVEKRNNKSIHETHQTPGGHCGKDRNDNRELRQIGENLTGIIRTLRK